MSEPRLVITLDKGEFKIEAYDQQGRECLEITKPFEEDLSDQVISRNLKPEFYSVKNRQGVTRVERQTNRR